MKTELIRMERVAKSIEGDEALHNINFNLYEGEILGLLGLNGSGKSTLAHLLSGDLVPDHGYIFIDNDVVSLQSTSKAKQLGIHYIGRKSKLVLGISIAENLFVICDNRQGNWFINRKKIYSDTKHSLNQFAPNLQPERLAGALSAREIIFVEIAKAVHEGARVIMQPPQFITS